jgi:hypothetical protein
LGKLDEENFFNTKISEFSVSNDIEELKRNKRLEMDSDDILDNFFEEKKPQRRSAILVFLN